MTDKHQVIRTHAAHPDWSASRIADHLGCGAAYVRATARRNALVLPRSEPNHKNPVMRERERCAAIAREMGAPTVAAAIMGEGNG